MFCEERLKLEFYVWFENEIVDEIVVLRSESPMQPISPLEFAILIYAAPDSTMPSTCPVPNFSGSFENFLLMA